jgi:ABC-type nitrate/sulfonate/bicarbonate transport system substrate-binding protein
MVRSGLRTPEDLRGKRFGIQSFGGNTWLFTMLALEQLHLDPTRDNIHLMVIGDQTLLNRALETGTIDALVLTTSVFSRSLKQKGFSSLRELRLPIAGVAIIARKSLIQQRPDTMENLLKAQIEGLAFALSPRHKTSVIDTLKKRLRVSSPAFLEDVYDDIVQGLERRPYPSIEGLKNIQRLSKAQNPRLAQLKVEDVVDDRFVRTLDESGFIGRLYASYGVK